MVRTRDFLLYIVIFVFILTGIAFTVVIDSRDSQGVNKQSELSTVSGKETVEAVADTKLDRQANLDALRAKLARGEGEIIQGAPVFTSVDTPTTTPEPNQEDISEENPDAVIEDSGRDEQFCVPKSYPAGANNWPKSGVTIREIEGTRVVSGSIQTEVTVGSTTENKLVEKSLLQLPVRPTRTFATNCLDSDYIGVALDGSLIKNSETWRFRNQSSESVIGYARDGHAIYGQGVDESLLDSCGGYDTGVGYQYHLREKELFVLGCYSATPQNFIE